MRVGELAGEQKEGEIIIVEAKTAECECGESLGLCSTTDRGSYRASTPCLHPEWSPPSSSPCTVRRCLWYTSRR